MALSLHRLVALLLALLVINASCSPPQVDHHTVSPLPSHLLSGFRSVRMEIGLDPVGTSAEFQLSVANDGVVHFQGGHFAAQSGLVETRLAPDELDSVLTAVQRANLAALSNRNLEACSASGPDHRTVVLQVTSADGTVRFNDHFDPRLCPELAPVKDLRVLLYDIARRRGWVT